MARPSIGAAALCLALAVDIAASAADPISKRGTMSGYDFAFTSIDGQPLPLAQYRGRPVLVVNTASFCGFTPQYEELEALWQRYRDRGVVVIGVLAIGMRAAMEVLR